MMRMMIVALSVWSGLAAMPLQAADAVPERLQTYRDAGAESFSAERGKAMWTEVRRPGLAGKPESCASCHTDNLTAEGKHFRTGKAIQPMSPAVNPERLTDVAKIEKWFLRNCKGTWGRECTAQEKGDFLVFIQQQ